MADNVGITTGSDVQVASDDVGGVQYQKVKLDLGGNGASLELAAVPASGLVAESVLLPAAALFFDTTTGRYRAPSGQVIGDGLTLPASLFVGAANYGWNGTGWDRLQVDGSKFLKVSVSNTPTVNVGTPDVKQAAGPWAVSGSVTATIAGTPSVSISNATLAVTQSGTWTVQQGTPPWTVGGPAASGVVATGNPVRNGMVNAQGILQDLLADNNRNLMVALGRAPDVNQTGAPWAVSGTIAATQSGTWTVQQGSAPWTVGGPAASGVVATNNPVRIGIVTAGGILQDLLSDKDRNLLVALGKSPDVNQTGGPWAVSGSLSAVITGGSIRTDKSSFTEGTSTFTPIGGVFNDTLAGDVTEDQSAAARMTARRALHINLRDSAGSEIGTTLTPVAVSGSVTATIAGTVTVDTELPAAAALSDTAANPTTPIAGAANLLYDASNNQWLRARTLNSSGQATAQGILPAAPVFWDKTASVWRAPSGSTLADGAANPTTFSVGAQLQIWNGAGVDRVRSAPTDGSSTVASGAIAVAPLLWLGGNDFGSLAAAKAVADGIAGGALLGTAGWAWNGAAFDRLRAIHPAGHAAVTNGLLGVASTYFDTTTGNYRAVSGMVLSNLVPNQSYPIIGAIQLTWDGTQYERGILHNSSADTRDTTLTGPISMGYNYSFDGTVSQWQRLRSLSPLGHTTTVGLQSTAPVFYDMTANSYRASSGQVLGDSVTAPAMPLAASFPMVWNGTTWDRLKDATAANGGGAGVLAAGVICFDTINGQYRRVNSVASASVGGLDGTRVLAVGNLLWDGSAYYGQRSYAVGGIAPAVNQNGAWCVSTFFDGTTGLFRAPSGAVLADGATVSSMPWTGAVGVGYNGSTYDRVKVDGAKAWTVGGSAASGVVATGNPVRIAGVTAGGILQDLQMDLNRSVLVAVNNIPSVNQGTSPWVVGGPAASGVVATGNPVRLGMVNTQGIVQDLICNSSRALYIAGNRTINTVLANSNDFLGVLAAEATTARVSYSDSALVPLSTDLKGNLRVCGQDVSGTVAAGDPVRVAGSNEAGIVQDLQLDGGRNLKITARQGLKATFMATTSGVVAITNTANVSTTLGYLWHPANNTKRCQIQEIRVSFGGGVAGAFSINLNRITAEAAVVAGVTGVVVATDAGVSVSAATPRFISNPTGLPTRSATLNTWVVGGGSMWDFAMEPPDWREGTPPVLRASTGEGYEIQIVCRTISTTAPIAAMTIVWTEE